MKGLSIQNLFKTRKFPGGISETLFQDFSLRTSENERLGLSGPNGCGKTTLLHLISGLLAPDSGRIMISGKSPAETRIAYVFQDYRKSLFPWLSVRENILFPLSLKRMPEREMRERLDHLAERLGGPLSLSKYPYQLSGGQQQFVALLRGLISDPEIMLLDEPFSSLDRESRCWLTEALESLFQEFPVPVIVVSHDPEFLDCLTERICFLSEKPVRILQEKRKKRAA